jgi:hypothetical protein
VREAANSGPSEARGRLVRLLLRMLNGPCQVKRVDK